MRLHCIISGKVQGVFFRAEVSAKAKQLGVTGWVRNNTNGSVEVVAEGEEGALKELLKLCKEGPPGAQVVSEKEEWSKGTNEFSCFERN